MHNDSQLEYLVALLLMSTPAFALVIVVLHVVGIL